jgi:formiminotetrahydrofolate cyclodeaminase
MNGDAHAPKPADPVADAGLDLASSSVAAFAQAIAAKTPTPGGGAVAGVTAAHAAALVAMVVRYSLGKRVFQAYETDGPSILASLHTSIDASLAAAHADAAAYGRLNALWKLPADDPTRLAGWAQAVQAAIAAPLLIVRLATEITGRCRMLAGATTKHLDSDLAIAADLAACAARAAAWNVRVNLPSLASADERITIEREVAELLAIARDDAAAVERALAGRG